MSSTLILGLMLLTATNGQSPDERQRGELLCSVTLQVVDTGGNPRPYRVDKFYVRGFQNDLAGKFEGGLHAERLYCESYDVALVPFSKESSTTGRCIDERTEANVMLFGPRHVLAIVQAKQRCLDPIGDGEPLVHVTFEPRPRPSMPTDSIWAALTPAFSQKEPTQQSFVDGSGTAAFAPVAAGRYVICLWSGRTLLAAAVADIPERPKAPIAVLWRQWAPSSSK